MRILLIISSGLCGLIACYMPLNVARPVEINTVAAKHVGQIEALQALKLPEASQVQPMAVEPPKPAPVASKPATTGGSCAEWIAEAGISDVHHAKLLIGGESGCRPNAINPSSGACGIPQSLPCSKMGCSLSDPVCQLKWMDGYIKNRYGTWAIAYATWQSRSPHWY